MSALVVIGIVLILVFGFNLRAGGILLIMILVPLSLVFLIGTPFYLLHASFGNYSFFEFVVMIAAVAFFPITIIGVIFFAGYTIFEGQGNALTYVYFVNAICWGIGGFWYFVFSEKNRV